MASNRIHRGWSVRQDQNDHIGPHFALYEKGQRTWGACNSSAARIWVSSDGLTWLCDGGGSAFADARGTFEAALDLAIDRIEQHRRRPA